jgi:hypothetical protein
MEIIVESFVARGENSSSVVRARPIPGQGLSSDLRVECSKSMRGAHPVGTLFRVWATWKRKGDGQPFLYSSYRSRYEVISPALAGDFLTTIR